jgi:predicted nuclease of predicted toxin-antitoxin system
MKNKLKEIARNKIHDLFNKLEKSHKALIDANKLDTYVIKNKAYTTFENRERLPLENFIYLCSKINSFTHSVSKKRHDYIKVDAYVENCNQYAIELNTLFNALLECYNTLINAPDVSYCVLLECCKSLQNSDISGVFSDKVKKYTFTYNDKEYTLVDMIYNFSSITGLRNMVFNEYQLNYFEQYLNQIAKLETLGEKICESEYKQWYKNHIYKDNAWQERVYEENEACESDTHDTRNGPKKYEKYRIFPWYYNHSYKMKVHNFKKDMAIVRDADVKYKVIDIDEYDELVSLYYRNYESTGAELITDRDIKYRYNKDTLSQSLMLINTGNVNKGHIEIVTVNELRQMFENSSKYRKELLLIQSVL